MESTLTLLSQLELPPAQECKRRHSPKYVTWTQNTQPLDESCVLISVFCWEFSQTVIAAFGRQLGISQIVKL